MAATETTHVLWHPGDALQSRLLSCRNGRGCGERFGRIFRGASQDTYEATDVILPSDGRANRRPRARGCHISETLIPFLGWSLDQTGRPS